MKVNVKKIISLAREQGYKVRDIERGCNFSRGYIYKMSNHEPSYIKLRKIAEMLKVDIDELVEE